MENYVRFCLMGGPIKMRHGIAPHIFNCQPDRKRSANYPLRLAFEKRRRKTEVADILANAECSSHIGPDVEQTENETPNIPTCVVSIKTKK